MTATLYGIKNCDTVKKARRWLDEHGYEYRFHDFRGDGLESATATLWIDRHGWKAVLNQRSASWRGLNESTRAGMDDSGAVSAVINQPTLIKRPVLVRGSDQVFGFEPLAYESLLNL